MARLAQLALQQTSLLPRVEMKAPISPAPEGRLRQRKLRLVPPPSAASEPTPAAITAPALGPIALTAAITAGQAAVCSITLDAPLGDAIVGAGDTLIIAQRPPVDGELTLIESADGTRRLRRVYRDGESVLLQPEDRAIRAERLRAEDVSIIGAVITIVRRPFEAVPAIG